MISNSDFKDMSKQYCCQKEMLMKLVPENNYEQRQNNYSFYDRKPEIQAKKEMMEFEKKLLIDSVYEVDKIYDCIREKNGELAEEIMKSYYMFAEKYEDLLKAYQVSTSIMRKKIKEWKKNAEIV